MIPSLRNKDDSKLIGTLNDVIYGYVIEERNGNFECELQYSIFSKNWDKLVEENIIVADASDTLKAQKFRIYKTTKPMNGIFTVYALHISFDTAKDMIDDIVVENQSCEYCLNKIFASSQFSQKYKGYSDIVNSKSFSIKSTKVLSSIAGESGSILDTFGTGAEILRDNYDFHVLNSRGHDNDVTIEYGKNLKDINFEVDTSSMITRIKPYAIYTDEAGNEITVYSNPKYVDSPNINNYATPYTESIDFSDKFGYDEIPTSAKLIYLAEKYFIDNNCDKPKISIKISFIPLSKCIGYEDLKDKISLCDTVTIIDSRYNYKDKAKVVKATYDFISERYESMEIGEPRTTLGNIIGGSGDSNKGEQGPPGPQGPPGEDGNIGDFPDTLPIAPTLSSTLYGFANIELSWTFEDKTYYTYELYASKIKNFKPSIFDAIFIGKASSFLFQAKPDETWYFRVCCVNSYGKRTEFSSQIAVTTIKIDDLSNYVENAAIGEALIGTLSLDRGWVGTLKGNYIDAKQLSVTDGNGKRTLYVDSFGHVYLDVAELKISSKQPATTDDLENLKGEINENLDNIEIGGKNYVKNYNFARKNYAWLCAGTGVVDTENQWGKMTTNTGASQIYQEFKNGEFKNGDVLTIQYEMKCDNIEVNTGSQSFNFAVYLTGYAADGSTYVDEVARFYNHNTDHTEYSNWKKVVSTCTVSSTKEYPITKLRLYCRNFKGDIYFRNIKIERGNKATDIGPAPEDTEVYTDNLIYDLQEQLDGKIQTYSQSTDPSTNWTTTEEKKKHEGDIWYNTSTKLTYRWSGTAWIKLSSQEAIDASELANSKAQIFTSEPIPPYKEGDLWITALDGTGVIKTCIKDRISGNYTSSDWKETLKYTDNTLANKLQNELNNLSIGGRNLVKNSAFLLGKGSWTFGTNVTLDTSKTFNGHPSAKTAQSGLTTNSYRGAITYNLSQTTFEKGEVCTISCYYYVEDKSTIDSNLALEFKGTKLGETQQQSSAIASYLVVPSDIVEGSWTRIYKTFTMPYTYEKCCIRGHLVKNGTAWFTDFELEKGNKLTDWTSAVEDTETYTDNLVADLQEQVDGKIQTYNQATDPSTSWTTTDLKSKHTGDLWYNTSSSKTYRWNGTTWVHQPEAEELAKSKKRIFSSTPTVPYDLGDLWILQSDTAHSAGKKGQILTCSTAKTSGSYSSSDWKKTITYTDDTTVNGFINNTYKQDLINLQQGIDKKADVYYQTSQPHSNYTGIAQDTNLDKLVGDLWYNCATGSKQTYIYVRTQNRDKFDYKWVEQEIPTEIFDTIDGKKSIYVSKPTKYSVNDLWILESDTIHSAGKKGQILTATNTSTSYNASHWVKKVSYTDDSYAKNVESKLEQRADKIELSVTEIQHDAYDIIDNGDFSATSTTNWVSSNITKSGPTTLNSKRWLRIYNTTESITTDGICSCEFTLKHDVTYSFNLLVAQRLSSMTFYRVTVEGFNSSVRGWQTVKTWTGTTMGTTASPTSLTYSYTYPTGSAYSKFRLAVKRLTTDPVMDIYITNISVTCKDSLVKTSQIKILSDSIESKVSSGNLGTLIQQNATSVKIAWNNISKYVQFESGELAIYNGSVSSSQKRATFDEDGNHFWRDGYYLGKIGTNQYADDNSIKGINFDLDYQGGYMTWAVRKTSTASTYTMMWSYANKTIGNYQAGKLHAGADIDMHNYTLRNVNFEGGGITGTMNFVQISGMNSNGTASSWYNNCKLQFQNGILISGTWG